MNERGENPFREKFSHTIYLIEFLRKGSHMQSYYIAGIVKEDDGSGFSVYFPDIPNIAAGGATTEEAIKNATDALYVALRGIAEKNETIPVPSTLEEARRKVREEREADCLPYPEDTLYQYFASPSLDIVPVRVNITIPRSTLQEIDAKAKLSGMTRSGYLAAAAQAFAR